MSAAIRLIPRSIPITAIPVRWWEIPCSRNQGTRREEPRKATKSRRQPRRGLTISVCFPVCSQQIRDLRPETSSLQTAPTAIWSLVAETSAPIREQSQKTPRFRGVLIVYIQPNDCRLSESGSLRWRSTRSRSWKVSSNAPDDACRAKTPSMQASSLGHG